MATEAELKAAIANLEAVLNSGANTIAQDGHTTVFDLDAAASRLRDLRKELTTLQGRKTRRPFFNKIRLD